MTFTSMSGQSVTYPELSPSEIYPQQAPAINLIDSIFDPTCNRSQASFGVAAMEMIEAACISATSGQNVLIPSFLEQTA
jgi:hypothetical protein